MVDDGARQLRRSEYDDLTEGTGESIRAVAYRHAEAEIIDLDELVRRRRSDAEEIVIDLRSADTHIDVEISVDAVSVREVDSTIDLRELEAFEAVPPEPAADPQTTTRIRPVAGLAVASPTSRLMKRAMDVSLAFFTLLVLSPLMIGVALVVAVTSAGPALYRSTRVGKDGEEFTFLKFRSMYVDADARKEALGERNEASGPVFKMRNDPRITPVGRFLRRTSLDELPQLFHVLTGRMSLVGPRPALPAEVAEYDDRERMRLAVRPGLTCIWQVSGRSNLGFDTWIAMDLEYIENLSLIHI